MNRPFRITSSRLLAGLGLGLALLGGCRPRTDKHTATAAAAGAPGAQAYQSAKNLHGTKVGYCSPSLNNPFYVALAASVRRSVEGYGMTYLAADGQDDVARQIAAVEDLLAKGCTVLILNPVDRDALVPITKAATQSGVAVFIVDSQIAPTADYVSSIQANNLENGILIGEWVANHAGKEPLKIALISGAKGNPVGREKRQGMLRGLSETQLVQTGSTHVQVVAQGWGNWANNGGLKAMEDILVAHPDVNVLLAENDAMAMGALRAISEAGKSQHILIAGVDGQKEAYELIKAGKMGCTALNSPAELGKLVVESAARYLNGEKHLDKVIYSPAVVVSAANVDRYYNPKALF